MSIIVGNLDLSVNVDMDIVTYNVLHIKNICTCMKVLALAFVHTNYSNIE